MIELNKRQYEILTFMANTGLEVGNDGEDVQKLIDSGLCDTLYGWTGFISPHAREMFRDAGFRRIN